MRNHTAQTAHPDHRKSWMAPAAKRTKYLLYVSENGNSEVAVYNYKNGKQVGTLTGFGIPEGQYIGAKGDAYISDFLDMNVAEYAHGGSSPEDVFDRRLRDRLFCEQQR
ncbi:MAG: hypothetical protein WAL67_02580 [Candidatus Cybelea sp.]